MTIWYDVDTALAEVPVNVAPLTDDTDFKTIETAIAYNAAGMALNWHFVTPAGAYTVTAVTPTTAGVYDWAHQAQGMYTIEIPASGGASINNDTEGYGWFTGFVTGVLPFRGPTLGFRAAGANDALIESWSATRGAAGTALPAAAADAAGGLPISDAGGLDLDARLDAAVSSRATVSTVQAGLGIHETTIATLTSQTVFTLTAGSADNNAYRGFGVYVRDSATSTQIELGVVSSYVGSSLEVTLESDPGIYVKAIGDTVILMPGKLTDVVDANLTQIGGVAQSATDLKDFADAGYDPSTNKVQGVVLVDTVTTLTGHTAQTGDSFARLGAPAGASVSADVAAVKGDTAATLADTGTDGVVVAAASKTGYQLSATGVDDILDEVYEGTTTLRQFLRLAASALWGKLSGGATTTIAIRDEADTKDRITATVDADGNRSTVTLDKS